MKLVSIIVPAYNSINVIDRCITSLLKQSYEDIEIIIVDDESTDETGSLCVDYERNYNNVKYYPIMHGGVSAVRNVGLEHATGDYVMFADADDYVSPEFVYKMVSAIEANDECDMAVCSYERVVYGGLYPIRSLQNPGIRSRDEYLMDTLRDPGHHYFGVLWNKIFKNSIIKSKGLRFKTDITLGEDFVFSLNYLKSASKVNVINDRLYYYCYQQQDTLSRVHAKNIADCEAEMNNRNKIFVNYLDSMESAGLYEKTKKRIYHYWIVFFIRQLYSLKHEYEWSEADKINWKKEMRVNANITKTLKIYKRHEVQTDYAIFACKQAVKYLIKKACRKITLRPEK